MWHEPTVQEKAIGILVFIGAMGPLYLSLVLAWHTFLTRPK